MAFYQNLALSELIQITLNEQGNNLILVNAEEYKQLKKCERTVLAVSSLTDKDIHSIKMTNMSEKHNHHNTDLDKQ